MEHTITVYDNDGNEHQIPAKWAICDVCNGDGFIANPAFDGMSTTEMIENWGYEETEEFLHEYTRGTMYQVKCDNEDCQGGKVLVPDDTRCTNEQMEWYIRGEQELADMRAMEAAERRMGC